MNPTEEPLPTPQNEPDKEPTTPKTEPDTETQLAKVEAKDLDNIIDETHRRIDGTGNLVINDYEELDKDPGSFNPKRVRFNGHELYVGQTVVSNGTHPDIPKGTEITIDLFDAGSDTNVFSQSLWVFGRTKDGKKVQFDPYNLEGYEDTKRDDTSTFSLDPESERSRHLQDNRPGYSG